MPAAIEDIKDIARYIATENPKRALSFIDELELRTGNLLATAPLSGKIYKQDTRWLPIGRYIVLYDSTSGASRLMCCILLQQRQIGSADGLIL